MPPDSLPPRGDCGALRLADHGGARTLAPGARLRLCLPEAPTSGYRWRGVEALAADAPLQCLASDYAPPAAVGGQGLRCWTFEARRAGSAALHLLLVRPGGGSAAGRFDLRIEIAS